jgi:hypothetical protein
MLPVVRPSWPGSMQSALAATLTTPEWWAMALAAFLLRGGILLVLIPIIALPTPAGFITDVSPFFEALVLGTPSLTSTLFGATLITVVLLGLAWAGIAGSWLDLALIRDAAGSDELELAWRPGSSPSSTHAFVLRLTAHLPTLVALGYAVVRIALVAYAQFTSPDDPGVPVVDRVVGRVPDAIAFVVVAWLVGEAVGGLAVRRASAGAGTRSALFGAVRQVLAPRGIATFVVTSAVLLVVALPFALAAQRAWEHARSYLLEGADTIQLTAAIVVLVSTWVLGLSIVGAALAWRATAWTFEVRPPREA